MKTLGVTGGIGSGKTTVCHILESLGARVFYADEVGKRVLEEDPVAREEIVGAFGSRAYLPDGSPDREYLARHVFGDEDRVSQINTIVHPRVYERFEAARREAESDGVPLLVMEAALIFESGGDRYLDAVAVVDAPRAVRVQRVTERDNVAPEQVEARMSHQLPPDELRARADYVIENEGDLENLERQVERVYREMVG